jgi:hypothetical protein
MNSDEKETIGAAASSATYKKVNNALGPIAGVHVKHGYFPSKDFEVMTEHLKGRSKERAFQYYERGLRRGFIEACHALLDGRLELKEGELYCSRQKIVISRKFNFSDGSSETRNFEFEAEDLD